MNVRLTPLIHFLRGVPGMHSFTSSTTDEMLFFIPERPVHLRLIAESDRVYELTIPSKYIISPRTTQYKNALKKSPHVMTKLNALGYKRFLFNVDFMSEALIFFKEIINFEVVGAENEL